MKTSKRLLRAPKGALTLAAIALLALLAAPAHASFTYSGNVYPADPSSWVSGADSYVGFTSDGSLTVSGGSALSSLHTILGFSSGVSGTATVTGPGSSWAMGSQLYVGFFGSGALNVLNGAAVSTGGAVTLGKNTGSTGTVTIDNATWSISGALSLGTAGTGTLNVLNGAAVTATGATTLGSLGTINFGDNGGTLTTSALSGPTSQITGTGTLVTRSWSGDFDLLVDGIAPTTQTVGHLTGTGQNVTVKLDIADSATSPLSEITIGHQATGSLTVKNGQTFSSTTNYVGRETGSIGTVTVDGTGSTWNAGTNLYLGYGGAGNVALTNGAALTGTTTYLGYNAGSTGTLTLDGSTLANSGTLYAGYDGTGAMNVKNGSTAAISGAGHIGYNAGSTGSVVVDGSTLTVNGLYVGNYGTGSLAVTNGGTLTSGSTSYVGYYAGSTGSATVEGTGSVWNAGSTLYVGLYGTGSVSVKDGGTATGTGTTYLGRYAGSTGGISVDGAGSNLSTGTLALYAGYNGSTGTISVTNGGTLTSSSKVYMGYAGGATGSALVDGGTWTMNNILYGGYNGNASMTITRGGRVTNTAAYLAYNSGYTTTVKVDGAGSTWTNTGALYIGNNGTGKVAVIDGGTVKAASVTLNNSSSVLTTDVGSSVIVNNGSGTITNKGTIDLVAGAGAANGTYTPMVYATLNNTGTVQALGGIWSSSAHTVTVADAAVTFAGTPVTFNLADTQRVLVTDGSGKSVGAGFLTAASSLTFSASAIGGSELASLESLLGPGETVLSGWDFSTTGYASGSPVYLSLFAGTGLSLADLEIWVYNGSTWSPFSTTDLAYDGTYASFTATNLDTYAVIDPPSSAPVPIPAAAWLLAPGLAGLIGIRRRTHHGNK